MNNSDYNILLRGILNTPILCDEIQNLQERTGALNLVKESWLQDLECFSVYQDHKNKKVRYNQGHPCGAENKAFVKTIIDREKIYNVIVAGEWYFKKSEKNKEHSILAKNCEPLNVIGLSMQEDEGKKLHAGARFFVKTCQPLMCHYCSYYHNENNIPIAPRNWCVLSLKMFNGKMICNTCKTLLKKALSEMHSFMAIMHLEVMSRTSFGDNNYKICGNINSMVVFQNTSLNLDAMYALSNPPQLSITYDDDDDQEDEPVIQMQ